MRTERGRIRSRNGTSTSTTTVRVHDGVWIAAPAPANCAPCAVTVISGCSENASCRASADSAVAPEQCPTSGRGKISEAAAAKKFAGSLAGECAVKADGLALGKGVLLTTSVAEAEKAIDDIMVGKAFGAAGSRVVIQEFLEGTEITLHALCDGKRFKLFPPP